MKNYKVSVLVALITLVLMGSVFMLIGCDQSGVNDEKFEELKQSVLTLEKESKGLLTDIEEINKKLNIPNDETVNESLTGIMNKVDDIIKTNNTSNESLAKLEETVNSLKTLNDTLRKKYDLLKVELEKYLLQEELQKVVDELEKINKTPGIELDYQVENGLVYDADVILPNDCSFDYISVLVKDLDGEAVLEKNLYSDNNFVIDFPYHGHYLIIVTAVYGEKEFSCVRPFNVLSPHYDLVYMNATLPVLLYGSKATISDNQYPTYMLIERAKTFNYDHLPANHYDFPGIEVRNNLAGNVFQNYCYDISNYVATLASLDSKATFTLNYVDNYTLAPIIIFDRNGISDDRWTANIWSDGKGTYNFFLREYPTKDKYDAVVKEFNDLRIAVRNGQKVNAWSEKYGLAATSLDNVNNYFIQDKSNMITSDVEYNKIFADELKELKVADCFNEVKANNKINDLEYLLNTRWGDAEDESMSAYFDKSDKPNLLILGTSPAGETSMQNVIGQDFTQLLGYVKDNYTDYDIFYKGHPRYPSNDDRKALFATNNVQELVNTIPVETLMILYPDVYIGGYISTAFLSAKPGQGLFVFNTEAGVRADNAYTAAFESGIFADTYFFPAKVA